MVNTSSTNVQKIVCILILLSQSFEITRYLKKNYIIILNFAYR